MSRLHLGPDSSVVTREAGDLRLSSVVVEAVDAAPNKWGRAELFAGTGKYAGFAMECLVGVSGRFFDRPTLAAGYWWQHDYFGIGGREYNPDYDRWWRIRITSDNYVIFDAGPDRQQWMTVGWGVHTLSQDALAGMPVRLGHVRDRGRDTVFDNLNVETVEESRGIPHESTLDWMEFPESLREEWHGRDAIIGIVDQGTTRAARARIGARLLSRRVFSDPPDRGREVHAAAVHGCLVMACGVPHGGRVVDAVAANRAGMFPMSAAVAAIRWCADQGADVINCSFGADYQDYWADVPYAQAFQYAYEQGSLVTISTGNSNRNYLASPAYLSEFLDNGAAVGAADESTGGRAFFSNYSAKMEGLAPGVHSAGLLPDGSRVTWNGTSASAPHAAHILGRLLTGKSLSPLRVMASFTVATRTLAIPREEQGNGAFSFMRTHYALRTADNAIEPAEEYEQGVVFGAVELAGAEEREEALDVAVTNGLDAAYDYESAVYVGFEYGLSPAGESETAGRLQVRTDRSFVRVAPIERGGARVIAQSMITGKFLHWDLPVHDLSIVERLSGPGEITGKLNPDIPDIRAVPLTPWGTWIHVEDEYGLIRASGILTTPFGVSGAERSLQAVGVSGYVHDVTFEGAAGGVQLDPLDIVRALWAHAQSWPNAKLGVIVSSDTSNVRVGGEPPSAGSTLTGPRIEIGDGPTQTSGRDGVTVIEYKPYQLVWWEHTVIGAEIDQLAANTPFDYVERSRWNRDRTGVDHFIDLRWPRAGTRRHDLRFTDGENIQDSIPVNELDSSYVTDVRVFGAGEGQDMVVGAAHTRSYPQVRRVAVLTEKTIKSAARARAVAQAELNRRVQPRGMERLLLDARHENAPVGSYQVGDDIFVQTEVDWLGQVNMWHRILDFTYTPDEEAVAVTVAPSSTFRYGNDA